MTKYKNKKVSVDDIQFDSTLESKYYKELVWLKQNKQIKGFELQPVYILQDKFKKDGKTIRAIKYKGDFKVFNNDGTVHVIDVKGSKKMLKSDFKIKWKMLLCKFPDEIFKCLTHEKGKGWVEID